MVETEEVPNSGVTVLSVEVDFCDERSSFRYSSYRLGCLRRLSWVQRCRSIFETTERQFQAHQGGWTREYECFLLLQRAGSIHPSLKSIGL